MQNADASLPLIRIEQDKKLSKLQADFNAKIKRISELKESIEKVKIQVVEINQRLEKELTPFEKERVVARTEFAKALVDTYHQIKMSQKDRETLSEMIQGELWDLIQENGQEELITLYDQFSETSYEEESKEVNEQGRKMAFDMFENMTGMNFSDFDLGEDAEGMDEFERMHRMKAAFEEKMREEEWQQNEKQGNRKKSAKQEAKERKMKEEAEMLAKSSRAIYMELAKELHPDREQDEKKRAWKTEIMQKVTVAYNNNDLYELLRLRLEYRQSEMDADAVPEQQLQLYIKILKEQVSALQEEYNSFFHFFNPQTKRLQQFGLGKAKQAVTRSINREKKEIQEEIERIQFTIRHTLKNPKELKQYLKEHREEQAYGNQFGGMLDSIFGGFGGKF